MAGQDPARTREGLTTIVKAIVLDPELRERFRGDPVGVLEELGAEFADRRSASTTSEKLRAAIDEELGARLPERVFDPDQVAGSVLRSGGVTRPVGTLPRLRSDPPAAKTAAPQVAVDFGKVQLVERIVELQIALDEATRD